MTTLNRHNRDSLFPVGAKASIVLFAHGGATVTHVTVRAHLKSAVKVTEPDGTVRTFTLARGYERGTATNWNKPYLRDHAEGLRIEADYAEINKAKARDSQQEPHRMNPDLDSRPAVTANWRAPSVPEGATLVFDEPGRTLEHTSGPGLTRKHRVDYGAFHYRVVKVTCGAVQLRVKHGGGEESMPLCSEGDPLLVALAALDSDARYVVLHALRQQYVDSAERTQRTTEYEYQLAFAEGRLKKRKRRGSNEVKVWIEPPARRTA